MVVWRFDRLRVECLTDNSAFFEYRLEVLLLVSGTAYGCLGWAWSDFAFWRWTLGFGSLKTLAAWVKDFHRVTGTLSTAVGQNGRHIFLESNFL